MFSAAIPAAFPHRALRHALALSLLAAGSTHAQEAPTVEEQLAEQDQRLKVLERKLELANEAATTAATSNATVKAGNSGFSISSADGRNVLKIRGNLNVDGRYFLDKGTSIAASSDTWLLRKVRPSIEGTLGGIYDFRFLPDFGSGRSIVVDAYVTGKFKPWLAVTAGKFKGPVGLERLQSDQYNRFIELGLPSALVPNRDLGVQLSGNVLNNTFGYALAYVDGVVDGGSTDGNTTSDADNDGKRELEARLFAQPFVNSDHYALRGLGIGIGGSAGKKLGTVSSAVTTTTDGGADTVTVTTNSLLAGYRTPGQQSFFSYRGDTATTGLVNEATYADGTHTRLAPQAYYYYGPLGLLGEYVQSRQEVSRRVNATTTRSDTLTHTAWQVSASWSLTGEDQSYSSNTPANHFEIGKPGWGAWEVAARYQELDIDDDAFVGGSNSFANPATAASKARSIGVALNWYLNQNLRWILEYDQTRFTGGAGTGTAIANRATENAVLTRFSLVF